MAWGAACRKDEMGRNDRSTLRSCLEADAKPTFLSRRPSQRPSARPTTRLSSATSSTSVQLPTMFQASHPALLAPPSRIGQQPPQNKQQRQNCSPVPAGKRRRIINLAVIMQIP
ncbi:hypothetical protein IG631_09212 [Alternaria alternata]|nr:hypothetical protein IG631_09212 [Alternaria alternata]